MTAKKANPSQYVRPKLEESRQNAECRFQKILHHPCFTIFSGRKWRGNYLRMGLANG